MSAACGSGPPGPLDGFHFVLDVDTKPEHFDWQQHLNNSAAVKLLEAMRIRYMLDGIGLDVQARLSQEHIMVVRELHVLYESQGARHERLRGGVRAASRTDKSFVLDELLVEAATGRVVARAWTVMLIVARDGGRAVPLPDWFVRALQAVEGGDIALARRSRAPWGPPVPPT